MKQVTVEFATIMNCRTEIMVPDTFDFDEPDYDYVENEVNRNLDNEKFDLLDEQNLKIRSIVPNEPDFYDVYKEKPLTNDEIFSMLYVEEFDNEGPDYENDEDSRFIEVEY